jgi:hypothetical protein
MGVTFGLLFKVRTKIEGRSYLEDLNVDGRIISEWILEKWGGKSWNGLIWLRIGSIGGIL